MKDGFLQLELDNKSAELCTFHTPYGRYKFKRMPFGLASAPEVFHRIISQVFGEVPGVVTYFDDIIISADTLPEHDEILGKVVQVARQWGLKFNKNKLQYRVKRVKYLGQVFAEEGISLDDERISAINNLRDPINKAELQTLLGMINYLGKFIPHLSQLTAKLRILLKKNVSWSWDETHRQALNKIKQSITKPPILKCYDSKRPLIIQADSSKDGLGCALLMDNGPIAFASRSLTPAEENYAQIEKELLAICFAVKKFNTFVYGRRVTVHTDHKPLESITKKDIGKITARLQRMFLFLLKYDLDIKYLPGKHMFVADCLSRNFPKTNEVDDPMFQERVHAIQKMLPITSVKLKEFQIETARDEVLGQIKKYIENGWPTGLNALPDNVKWAWKLRDDLYYRDGLILLDDKIMVPDSKRHEMLDLLHESHLGIVKCKKKARQAIYWKGMAHDIEEMIRKCKVCEKFGLTNVKQPILQTELPSLPFQVVGSDICSYAGRDYLVTGCYLTKWLEVQEIKAKTSEEVIQKLKLIFSTHGIPKLIVSDNMPFASHTFKKFTESWGIQQRLSSPHYPKGNGLSEKMVGIAKLLLKKTNESQGDFNLTLLDYRNTPLDGMEVSPAQLMMSRRLRTKLPVTDNLLEPNIVTETRQAMVKNKERQERYYNQHTKERKTMKEGDGVLIQRGPLWQPGIVKEVLKSPRSYKVMTQGGQILQRNSQHLRVSHNPPIVISKYGNTDVDDEPLNTVVNEKIPDMIPNQPVTDTYKTRSGRVSRRPERFKDYV